MMNGKTVPAVVACILLLLAIGVSHAEPRKVQPGDKCQVCGMFVAKYPDWIAQVVFKDGTYAFFDGPKDMFTYCLNLQKYSPSRSESDIVSTYVTEYYSLKMIDARKASYVIGSDTYGPMGKELIPFADRQSAEEFMKDHKGKNVLVFDQVTPDVLKSLE
ncbi:MAG: nitrous oxide reductase accessory protein NosL [bacterium]